MPETIDFSILERADISQRELAALLKVSPGAVHHWVRGRRRPSERMRYRLIARLKQIEEAVEAGKLPLSEPHIIYTKTRPIRLKSLRDIVN